MRKVILLAIVVIAIGGGGYYLWNGKPKESSAPVGQVQRILKLSKGDLSLNVSANGVVQPINKVEIKSKASGQVLFLGFEEGESVQQGRLLAILDTVTAQNDFDQAKSDLEVAKAALIQSENNVRRAKELFQKSLISQQELDAANTDYVRTQSSLIRGKSMLSTAEVRLKETRISAPISGIILSRNIELGQIVASGVSNVGGGTILASIADMEEVNVETNVDEVDIGRVNVGQSAKVIADAFPDDQFNGEIVRIAPLGKTQQNVTSFVVIVRVKNVGGKLKAGMSASVDIEIFNRKNVLLIPNEALKDPRTEQGKAIMTAAGLTMPKDDKPKIVEAKEIKKVEPEAAGDSPGDFQKMRERMQNASPEEREKMRTQMRERMEKMSPEERQKMFEQFRQRMGSQGGGQQGGDGFGGRGFGRGGEGGANFGGGPGGGEGSRVRRQSQVSANQDVTKWRLTIVKQGEAFVGRFVKVGPSNFDNSEVLEGLQEGDEIQVTTISRAKIASQEFNDRMKSMQSMGGMSGGAGRGATGTGGGGGGGRR